MPEGYLYILTTKSQKPHLDKTRSFLSEHDVPEVKTKSLSGGIIELSAECAVEFPIKDIAALWSELVDDDEWYRLFDWNEYGDEAFLYVDKDDAWRMCASQEEPGAKTVEAYRRWHNGLGKLKYGGVDESELERLEYQYGLFDGDGQPMSPPSPALRQQVGSDASFLGRGIQVPHAGPYWDWYIPDHECLAVKLAAGCDYPSDDGTIRYRRTYMLEGDPGFVWSWLHAGVETCLLFMYYGESSNSRCLVRNFGQATLNELILAAYFEEEIEEGFDEPESWMVSPGDEEMNFMHEPLQSIDIGPFDTGNDLTIFDGRVISAYGAVLLRRDGNYFLAQYKGAKRGEQLEIADPSLDNVLKQHAGKFYAALDKGVSCQPKVRITGTSELAALVGIRFLKEHDDTVLLEWLEDRDLVSEL